MDKTVEEREQEMMKFADAKLPYLRKIHELEKYEAEIAEYRVRKVVANHRLMEFQEAQKQAQEKTSEKGGSNEGQ
jgi:hypothetical protein